MNTGFNNSVSQVYMRYKKKDLKWYQRFWNCITGHKDKNWIWLPVGNGLTAIGDDHEI